MATLSFSYGPFAEGAVTYTTSSTEYVTTIHVSRITLESDYMGENNFTYTISFASTILASGTFKLKQSHSASQSLDADATIGRTHVAQSIRLSVSGSGAGETADGETTVTVPAKRSYNVTFNANGGTGAPETQYKYYDETLTLPKGTPTRTDYEFYHWNTNAYNTGTTYAAGGYYDINAALSLYAIWNPIVSYNANAGNGGIVGNMPRNQVKTYGVTLQLSSTVPVRNGYQFEGWYANSAGTGTKYNPGGNYTSNTAIKLYAKWIKVAEKPTIQSISVVRSDSNGDADDTGTYCKVTAEWYVDTTSQTITGNTGTVTGTIKEDGGYTSRSITFSSGASGTSGTAVALVDSCDTDKQYIITVTVTDLAASTSRSDIMTRAFFTMDFKAGGNAIGIGVAAPSDGLEVGWDVQLDQDLNILGNIVAGNLQETVETTVANIISAQGNWTISSASVHTYGKLRSLNITARSTTALTANQSYGIGIIADAYAPSSSNYVTGAFLYGSAYIVHTIINNIPRVGLMVRPHESVSANTTIYFSLTYYAW